MNEWISVDDRLPDDGQIVLGYTPRDGNIFVGYHKKDPANEHFRYREKCHFKEWFLVTSMRSTQKVTKRVTHWMPFPTPPENRT